MAVAMIDTAKRVDDLEAVKIPREQARAIVDLVRSSHEAADVATKADIELLRKDTKADIELLRKDTKADIELLRKDTKADIDLLRKETKADIELLRKDMEGMRKDIIIWLGGLLIAGFGLVVGLMLKMGS